MVQNVLVVGDSDELTGQIKRLNGQEDGFFHFHIAKEHEISAKALEFKPDYLLIDSSVVQRDDIDKLRTLNQIQISNPVPVILLTSVDETDELSRFIDLGISDFILKPLDLSELISRLV